MKKILLSFAWFLILLTACSNPPAGFTLNNLGVSAREVDRLNMTTYGIVQDGITVAAAADLQFAFRDLAELFEEQTGQRVTLVFGSTGYLSQQIENGAPYDLLAAADFDYIRQLAQEKLVLEESIAFYARGRIVLAANTDAGVSVSELKDLLLPQIQRVAIANPEHAPYGLAARQALEAVGIWDEVLPKLVLSENIRQALQYVQNGDAQAAILALSVADVPEITWSLIDDSLHQPLDQAIAVVASSPQPELAARFSEFINSETGRPVMRHYGFILPEEARTLTPAPHP